MLDQIHGGSSLVTTRSVVIGCPSRSLREAIHPCRAAKNLCVVRRKMKLKEIYDRTVVPSEYYVKTTSSPFLLSHVVGGFLRHYCPNKLTSTAIQVLPPPLRLTPPLTWKGHLKVPG